MIAFVDADRWEFVSDTSSGDLALEGSQLALAGTHHLVPPPRSFRGFNANGMRGITRLGVV